MYISVGNTNNISYLLADSFVCPFYLDSFEVLIVAEVSLYLDMNCNTWHHSTFYRKKPCFKYTWHKTRFIKICLSITINSFLKEVLCS